MESFLQEKELDKKDFRACLSKKFIKELLNKDTTFLDLSFSGRFKLFEFILLNSHPNLQLLEEKVLENYSIVKIDEKTIKATSYSYPFTTIQINLITSSGTINSYQYIECYNLEDYTYNKNFSHLFVVNGDKNCDLYKCLKVRYNTKRKNFGTYFGEENFYIDKISFVKEKPHIVVINEKGKKRYVEKVDVSENYFNGRYLIQFNTGIMEGI